MPRSTNPTAAEKNTGLARSSIPPDYIEVLPMTGPAVVTNSTNAQGPTNVLIGKAVTISWKAFPLGVASNSVRIELFRYKNSHSHFVDVLTKRATEGAWDWVVPEEHACTQNLFFVIRSRRRKAAHVMSASEVFNVVDRKMMAGMSIFDDVGHNTENHASDGERCGIERRQAPVGDCGPGWRLVSTTTRGTAATMLYRPRNLMLSVATFRGRLPVLSKGQLVPGSVYYKHRLAYFEVEVLHTYDTSAKLAIGWVEDGHPLENVALGESNTSVGYWSDDGAMVAGHLCHLASDVDTGSISDKCSTTLVSGHNDRPLRSESIQSTSSMRDVHAPASMYSQEWTDADVVGCGLDCKSGDVFFTLNGNLLALPFKINADLLLGKGHGASNRLWPAFSAACSTKVRVRVADKLTFDGFAEVLESLEQRVARDTFRKNLRTQSAAPKESPQGKETSKSDLNFTLASPVPTKCSDEERSLESKTSEPHSLDSSSSTDTPVHKELHSVSGDKFVVKVEREQVQGNPSLNCFGSSSGPSADSPHPVLSPAGHNSGLIEESTKSVSSWSEEDVIEWLSSFRALRRYTEAFEELGVDGHMLANVTDEDLKLDLGVSVRLHRVKLLKEVKRLVLQSSNTERKSGFAPRLTCASVDGVSASVTNPGRSTQSSIAAYSVESIATTSQSENLPQQLLTEPSADSSIYSAPAEEATIVALFSSPLVDESRHPVPLLAHDVERQIICSSLRTAKRSLSLRMSHASTDSLCAAVTMGCRVLHFSGHADPLSLSFEDSTGLLHRLDVGRLKDLFGRRIGGSGNGNVSSSNSSSIGSISSSIGGALSQMDLEHYGAAALVAGHVPEMKARVGAVYEDRRKIQATSIPPLVFVSACHSQAAGEAFLAAGAEHVVAVERDERIEDRAAHAFTRSFYLALAVGHSVESSFQIGQTAVSAVPGKTKGDAIADAEKFVLLPANGSHDVKLFEDIPLNGFFEPPPMVCDIVPSPPEGFTGRQIEIHSIIQQLKLHRTVSVVGPAGVGKSGTAIMAANYMSERSMFRDGILFLRSQFDDEMESLSNQVLDEWVNKTLRNNERKRIQNQSRVGGFHQKYDDYRGTAGLSAVTNVNERVGSGTNSEYLPYQFHSGLHEVLVRLSTAECLIVIDQAGGGVGDFVRTVCERTRSVRFLLTTKMRSIANEHSVELGPLSASDATLMFLRRLPRSNLAQFFRDEVSVVWNRIPVESKTSLRGQYQGNLRVKRKMLEIILSTYQLLLPFDILHVCSLMRDPEGETLDVALGFVRDAATQDTTKSAD